VGDLDVASLDAITNAFTNEKGCFREESARWTADALRVDHTTALIKALEWAGTIKPGGTVVYAGVSALGAAGWNDYQIIPFERDQARLDALFDIFPRARVSRARAVRDINNRDDWDHLGDVVQKKVPDLVVITGNCEPFLKEDRNRATDAPCEMVCFPASNPPRDAVDPAPAAESSRRGLHGQGRDRGAAPRTARAEESKQIQTPDAHRKRR